MKTIRNNSTARKIAALLLTLVLLTAAVPSALADRTSFAGTTWYATGFNMDLIKELDKDLYDTIMMIASLISFVPDTDWLDMPSFMAICCTLTFNANGSCTVSFLGSQMGEIDWSRTAVETERLIRAFTPWPGTFTHLRGKVLKILGAEVVTRQEMEDMASEEGSEYSECEPGCVAAVSKDAVCIATGGDYLKITRLQLEGKKKMDTAEFLKGCRIDTGERLG